MKNSKKIAAVVLTLSLLCSVIVTPATDRAVAKKQEVSLKKSSVTLSIIQNKKKITRESAKIKVKKSKGVKIKKITYSVAKSKIAKVSKSGKVTAKNAGATKITVKVKYK